MEIHTLEQVVGTVTISFGSDAIFEFTYQILMWFKILETTK